MLDRLKRAYARRNNAAFWRWKLAQWTGSPTAAVSNPLAAYPLIVRTRTTDWSVYQQIFEEVEYQCLPGDLSPVVIVDLGANVGYSSAYFLTRYPACSVIAVEPDADNFAAMERNLRAYGARVQTLLAAAWSSPGRLALRTDAFRGGGAWARQVQADNDGKIEAIDIDALMQRYRLPKISILKMDIEGAEVEVFKGSLDWLDRVDVLVAELHDDSSFGPASPTVIPEMHRRGFRSWTHGELIVFRRPKVSDSR